jgi:antitoxin component YwqK of YwqJK toxin-antitoxin module
VVYERGEIINIKGKDVSRLGPEYDYHSYPNEKYKSALSFKDGVYLVHYRFHEGGIDTPGTGGELAWEIPLKNGFAEGLVKDYHQKPWKVMTAACYKAGVKNGIEHNFYPNGALRSEISFKDGEKDGPEKRYPKRAFPVRALKALVRGGPEKPEKELYFHKGIQTGLMEDILYSTEPFEDDDYNDGYEENDD